MIVKRILINYLRAFCEKKQILKERKREESLIISNYPSNVFLALTPEEKNKVIKLWGGISSEISFKEYEVYKYLRGFDERFLSHELYLPLIYHALNNYHYTKFFEDKGLLGYLTRSSQLTFPYCYVRCISGECYTNDMRQLDRQKAIMLCEDLDEFIFKISRESSGGHGVQKIVLRGKDQGMRKIILEKLFGESRDFVIQEIITQHPSIAKFNATSINTLRFSTLYLNNCVTIQSIVLRIGQKGAFVDNLGSGGVGVGIKKDGSLNDFGYTYALEKMDSYNGITFKGQIITQIPEILNTILASHIELFPLCNFIGWDVCIDKDNKPVIIEINSSQPGISGQQIHYGPIFGDRTQEVIDYCLQKRVS